jgi:predicted alpha/beta hydrolase family esterase
VNYEVNSPDSCIQSKKYKDFKETGCMLDNTFNYINVPGLAGSGENHWQTYWEKESPEIIRVEQKDWNHPVCTIWVEQLVETIRSSEGKPIVLIGHSLGCASILHAAHQKKLMGVAGAFLVAMPDVERTDFPKVCIGFTPMPRIELPFASIMVASENDPYISSTELKVWAEMLGSEFISVGNRGHIGSLANVEYWKEGQDLFANFVKRLKAQRLMPIA